MIGETYEALPKMLPGVYRGVADLLHARRHAASRVALVIPADVYDLATKR